MVRKVGYVGQNLTLGISASHTLRLARLNAANIRKLIDLNLEELQKILHWNIKNNIYFFRITSQIIPFASHAGFAIDWRKEYRQKIAELGKLIKQENIRVSMHPGQYTVLNAKNRKIVENSIREIEYHTDFLDLMELDSSHKIIIHLGGKYGDKLASLNRFSENYQKLRLDIKARLVIENDDKSFNIYDCMKLSKQIGAPIVFDYLHYAVNHINDNRSLNEIISKVFGTWKNKDGLPEVHFSSQALGRPAGYHAVSIDLNDLRYFIKEIKNFDFDLMLETKDKEKSVLRVLSNRFVLE